MPDRDDRRFVNPEGVSLESPTVPALAGACASSVGGPIAAKAPLPGMLSDLVEFDPHADYATASALENYLIADSDIAFSHADSFALVDRYEQARKAYQNAISVAVTEIVSRIHDVQMEGSLQRAEAFVASSGREIETYRGLKVTFPPDPESVRPKEHTWVLAVTAARQKNADTIEFEAWNADEAIRHTVQHWDANNSPGEIAVGISRQVRQLPRIRDEELDIRKTWGREEISQ